MLTRNGLILVACGLVFVGSAMAGPATTVDDVVSWTGTGSDRAVIVIDWNNGETDAAMAWGVQFDSTINAATALRAICENDPKLYGVENTGFGSFWMGFGYDANASGPIGVNIPTGPATPYTPVDGVVVYNDAWNIFNATPLDPNDYFAADDGVEWNWGIYAPDDSIYQDTSTPADGFMDIGTLGASETYADITFAGTPIGVAGMEMQNNSWLVLSFGQSVAWVHQAAPDATAPQAATVPEPTTLGLLAVGAAALLRRRKQK